MLNDMLHLVSGVQPPEHLGAPHHLRGHHVYLALQLREHGTPGVQKLVAALACVTPSKQSESELPTLIL